MLERFRSRVLVSAWLLLAPAVFAAVPATPPKVDLSAVGPEARSAIEAAQAEVAALGQTGTVAARAESWGKLGMFYLKERLLDAAEPCFLAAQEIQQDQMRWSYYLAVVQQKKGDLKSAAESLKRALQVREGNLPIALRLAGVLADLGDTKGAEELYTSALQSPLGVAAGQAGLGRLALGRGDAKAAVAHYEKAIAAQPEANALHHQLSLALAAAGDLTRSRQEEALAGPRQVSWPDPLLAQLEFLNRPAFRPAGEDPRIDTLRRAVETNKKDVAARRELGQALVETRDLPGAQEQYEEIVRLGRAEARDYLELGSVKADRQRDVTAGIPDLRKALELDPKLVTAHQRLAHMLTTLGKVEEANEHLQAALALEPNLLVVRLQLARNHFATGKLPEALAATNELLKLEPGNLEAILMRGRVLAGQNQPDAARKDFERVSTAGAAAPSQKAEALFNLGLIYQASNDLESAIAEYRRALDQDAFHLSSLAALGAILAGRGDVQGALPLFVRLAGRQPENLELKYRLAALQMQVGDTQAAQKLFEELYRAEPGVPEFIATSALLLAEIGQGDAGIARIEQALPTQKDAQIRQRLLAARARIESRAGKVDTAVASYRQALALAESPELRLELAQALALAERYPAAAQEYDVYLKARPQDEGTHFARAMVLIWAGRFGDARDRLVEITALSSNVPLTHLLARVLASAPDAKVRQGERAVQIATAVFEKERNPIHGETLAMALAAAGRFSDALTLQKRLLLEAEQAKFDAGFINRVQGNLARYEKGEVGVSDW